MVHKKPKCLLSFILLVVIQIENKSNLTSQRVLQRFSFVNVCGILRVQAQTSVCDIQRYVGSSGHTS